MQDPNHQSMYGDQSSSLSPVKRLLKSITWKVALGYGAAAFFFVGFLINDLPHTSTTMDMFIAIAVFFASVMFLALLTLHERCKREQHAQLNMEGTGGSHNLRRSTLGGWLVGILVLSLAIAYIVSTFYTTNPLAVEVVRSFAAGNLVVAMVSWANKARRDEPESEPEPAPYRDRRGNYD
jgi:hypothetical protein